MTADDLSADLRWPDRTEPAPTPPAPDAAEAVDGADPEPPAPPVVPTEVIDGEDRAWRASTDPFQRSAPSGLVATATGGRFMMEAYDRLADRVLDRLRSMREGVDEDLGILRSEVASLRTSVEDVADRVQLRKVRTDVYQLRTEVAGLRAAVLEWPELEAIAERTEQIVAELQAHDPGEVTALAEEWVSELATVRDALAAQPQQLEESVDAAVRAALADVRDDIGRLTALVEESTRRPVVGALAPVVEELATVHQELRSLHDELAALRRRIALRAEPVGAPTLDDEQLGRLADAVAARLRDQPAARERRR